MGLTTSMPRALALACLLLLACAACKDDGDGGAGDAGASAAGGPGNSGGSGAPLAGSRAEAGHGGGLAGASGAGSAGGSAGSSAQAGSGAGGDAEDGGVPNPSDACSLPPLSGNCDAFIPRYYHVPESGSCERFVYGGCGGNDNNFETLAECEQACDVSPRSEPCSIEATDPSLPGVRVRVEGDRCRVQSGYGGVFRYAIEVDDPITYTAPDSGGACGRCGGYSDDPLTLVSYAIEGEPSHYCECDVGCCPPTTAVERTLRTGSFESELAWPGYEWSGPSDTAQPLGPPFTPGAYDVVVTLDVPGEGTVVARLPIEVFLAPPSDPGAVACEVNGMIFNSGSEGIDDPVSCNTCSCDEGQLSCTEIACPEPCPAGTTFAVSCARCGPADGCEIVRHACMPGCDTDDDCEAPGASCIDGACKTLCG